MVASESYDGWSPHFRLKAGEVAHQLYQLKTVITSLFRFGKRVDEVADISICLFCFQSGHERQVSTNKDFPAEKFIKK